MSSQKESLLEKAKSMKKNNHVTGKITDEHIELALAWAAGEIGYSQVQKALGSVSASAVYSFLAFSLKKYIETIK